MAVNVTLSPKQMLVELAIILTLGVNVVDTVITIALDVAVLGLTQAALLVISTVTESLSLSVMLLKVAEFVPAFTPSTFH